MNNLEKLNHIADTIQNTKLKCKPDSYSAEIPSAEIFRIITIDIISKAINDVVKVSELANLIFESELNMPILEISDIVRITNAIEKESENALFNGTVTIEEIIVLIYMFIYAELQHNLSEVKRRCALIDEHFQTGLARSIDNYITGLLNDLWLIQSNAIIGNKQIHFYKDIEINPCCL